MFPSFPRLSGFLLVALTSLVLGLRLEVAGPPDDCEEACCCQPSVEESCCDTEEPLVTMTSTCGCGGNGEGLHFDGTNLRWIDVEPGARLLSVNHGPWPRALGSVLLDRASSPESPPPRPSRSS